MPAFLLRAIRGPIGSLDDLEPSPAARHATPTPSAPDLSFALDGAVVLARHVIA